MFRRLGMAPQEYARWCIARMPQEPEKRAAWMQREKLMLDIETWATFGVMVLTVVLFVAALLFVLSRV